MNAIKYILDDLKFLEDGTIDRAVFVVDGKEIYIVEDFRASDDNESAEYTLSVGKIDGDALVFYKEVEPRHEETIDVILEDIMTNWSEKE